MIVIPDIHGRTFWKKAVQGHEDEIIVFLGDYMDPYYDLEPDINYQGAINNLREIINFKKQHMNNVVLLVGNHDFHYLYDVSPCTRFDHKNFIEISNCFCANEDLFQMAYEKEIAGKIFIFTHAGVRVGWVENNKDTITVPLGKGFADHLNQHMRDDLWANERDLKAFENVGYYRGGRHSEKGSPIWADAREHLSDYKKKKHDSNVFQVFGHTQLTEPFIGKTFACLDCHRGFEINETDGKIYELNLPTDEPQVQESFDKYLNKLINEELIKLF